MCEFELAHVRVTFRQRAAIASPPQHMQHMPNANGDKRRKPTTTTTTRRALPRCRLPFAACRVPFPIPARSIRQRAIKYFCHIFSTLCIHLFALCPLRIHMQRTTAICAEICARHLPDDRRTEGQTKREIERQTERDGYRDRCIPAVVRLTVNLKCILAISEACRITQVQIL